MPKPPVCAGQVWADGLNEFVIKSAKPGDAVVVQVIKDGREVRIDPAWFSTNGKFIAHEYVQPRTPQVADVWKHKNEPETRVIITKTTDDTVYFKQIDNPARTFDSSKDELVPREGWEFVPDNEVFQVGQICFIDNGKNSDEVTGVGVE